MSFNLQIPKFLSHLPVDPRGYPIPFFVPKTKQGYNFKYMDPVKQQLCIEKMLCPICGLALLRKVSYVITGPIGAKNRVVTDPPMHKGCAEFALRACPHMFFETAVRKGGADILDGGPPSRLCLIRVAFPWKAVKYQLPTGPRILIEWKPVSRQDFEYVNGRLDLSALDQTA